MSRPNRTIIIGAHWVLVTISKAEHRIRVYDTSRDGRFHQCRIKAVILRFLKVFFVSKTFQFKTSFRMVWKIVHGRKQANLLLKMFKLLHSPMHHLVASILYCTQKFLEENFSSPILSLNNNIKQPQQMHFVVERAIIRKHVQS